MWEEQSLVPQGCKGGNIGLTVKGFYQKIYFILTKKKITHI